MTQEAFLPHPLYSNQLIGTRGTVWSVQPDGSRRLRVQRVDAAGYVRVNMPPRVGCNGNGLFLHRLIAVTHIPNPCNLTDVNHINHIKTDNRVENLEWVTHADNMRKAREFHGNWTTGERVRKPVIATPVGGGPDIKWPSVRAWAIDSGNFRRAANVCKALRSGKAAHGYYWRFDIINTTNTSAGPDEESV